MMDSIIIRLENLSINQICKILDGPLPAVVRHYKNKRPPPLARQPFDTPITIWIYHHYHLIL